MTALADTELERLARRRAGMKMGWYIHAGVYIAVNLMLAALSYLSGRHWAVFPAFGWGLGLAIHGVVVYLVAGGSAYEGMVERERRRLQANPEPW
ncbi:2TM domain-containing protein [Ramlibacter pallidus]|uniref:2TM domain-containing protein n=1 Tax=Ramlibacter pallidus TaxID=2780087 RepID=A0ABR9S520_9BURK|nr:2TM domain-containing protein [Ramlibacter pallidus]MBE7368581.1 2TM domain-containing protein [Ramlibacter pallidus]